MNFDLSLFSDMKDKDFSREGLIALEGRIVIEKAIQSKVKLEALVCIEDRAAEWRARANGEYPVFPMKNEEIGALLGFKFHHGAIALARRPHMLDTAAMPHTGAWLCLWETTDPSNVGALIRTATGFGAMGVLVGPRCADPFYRKALRTSMGNSLATPIYSCSYDELADLSHAGFSLTAASLSKNAVPLRHFAPAYPLVLIVGNEGYGLPAEVLNLCSDEVVIPMAEGLDSLNVVVAASICMYALFDPAQARHV